MNVTASIFGQIKLSLSNAADLGQAVYSTDPSVNSLFAAIYPGTGNFQAQNAFVDERTLAASANEDLDLSGALINPLGAPAVFTAVKALLVRASAANTNNVVVKPGATNGFLGPFGAAANTITLLPGEMFLVTNQKGGWPVVASTGDLLNVANSGAGTPVTYDITIIGV